VAKNRYVKRRVNTKEGYKTGFAKKFTILSIIGVCLALAYLWQHTQSIRLGYELREKEQTLAVLKKENQCLRLRICQLKAPSHIEKVISRLGLDLVYTKNWQYVYLKPAQIVNDKVKAVVPNPKVASANRSKKISFKPTTSNKKFEG